MGRATREYLRNHEKVRAVRGSASNYRCSNCNNAAQCWAQIHETTGEDPSHYQPMCWPCHHKYDDRWNAEERAKVSETTRSVWANSPERRAAMSKRMSEPRGSRFKEVKPKCP